MKKIAYIELDTHSEIASNFMELMQDSKVFEVDFFFSEKVFRLLGRHQSNIHITDSASVVDELKMSNYSLVIIGTAHRYFNTFETVCEQFNTAILVHNLNFSKASKWALFRNVFRKEVLYRCKLLLKEDLLSAPEVYRKAKHLLVVDETAVSERFKYVPLLFYVPTENEIIPNRIVIPGAVSQKRRDYNSVFRKIRKFSSHAEIVFLGKAKGKELQLLKNTEKKLPKNISVRYFTEKVPSSKFDEVMRSAAILWCPIQKETQFFGVKEIYGKTKMSGNIGDAIKYGKMALFPKDFQSKYPFIVNDNERHTEELLYRFSSLHYDFQKAFSKEKIQTELEEVVKKLI